MDDWLQEADLEREDASAGRVHARARGRRSGGRGACGLPRERTLAGARRGRRRRRARDVGGARRAGGAARRTGLPGVVRRPRRLPPGPPPVRRRCCRRTAPACASGWRPTTSSWSSARARSASRRGLPGRFTAEGTRVALVSEDPAEVHRSPVELAVLAPPAAAARALAAPAAAARRRSAAAVPLPAAARSAARRASR